MAKSEYCPKESSYELISESSSDSLNSKEPSLVVSDSNTDGDHSGIAKSAPKSNLDMLNLESASILGVLISGVELPDENDKEG